jgi:hypothetical protein
VQLDDRERRVVEVALIERQARLVEKVGDTIVESAERQVAAAEAALIMTVLGRL